MLTVVTISFDGDGPFVSTDQTFLGLNPEQAADKAFAFLNDLEIEASAIHFDEVLAGTPVTLWFNGNKVTVKLSGLTNSHEFSGTLDLTPFEDVPVDEGPVYLYILMRNDLASLNPGKAVAQGTHAANQMVYEARQKDDPALNALLHEWEQETSKGFGTCICLSVDNAEMHQIVDRAIIDGIHAAVTHDPSYPLRDGRTMHFIPLDTCAYVFARKVDVAKHVGALSLMA